MPDRVNEARAQLRGAVTLVAGLLAVLVLLVVGAGWHRAAPWVLLGVTGIAVGAAAGGWRWRTTWRHQ